MGMNFYAFTQNNRTDTGSVEAALAEIDRIGARLMHKLEKGRSLTEKERFKLSEFISVMWRRTAQHKSEAERRAAQMMPDFFKQHDEGWLAKELAKRGVSPGDGEVAYEKQNVQLANVRAQYLNRVPDFLFPRNIVRPSMFEQTTVGVLCSYQMRQLGR